jgi:hypothetical protein
MTLNINIQEVDSRYFISFHYYPLAIKRNKDQLQANMPTYWDLCLVLDVYPLREKFNCTGTTTKGEQCGQTFIDRRYESDRILEVLSSKDVVTYGLDERMKLSLRILAEQTLCPRWHRNGYRSQTNDVYLKWFRTINNFIVQERSRRQVLHKQIPRPIRAPEPVRAVSAVPVAPNDRVNPQPGRAREPPPAPMANEGRPQRPRDVVSPHS